MPAAESQNANKFLRWEETERSERRSASRVRFAFAKAAETAARQNASGQDTLRIRATFWSAVPLRRFDLSLHVFEFLQQLLR